MFYESRKHLVPYTIGVKRRKQKDYHIEDKFSLLLNAPDVSFSKSGYGFSYMFPPQVVSVLLSFRNSYWKQKSYFATLTSIMLNSEIAV